ncbi:hypothetical protein ACFYYB_33770 [Streptomyces sp. NPDC002886]|uniref:hypothetical protein n=1 Tax=Streptomyces sp. NPDC002886 TaxID=3364667 RepID=UPI0036ACD4CD
MQLHLISAENTAGDPSAAIAAADALAPQALPTTERRALYFTDRAKAFAQWGRRDECIRALLQAEYWAPQETHARPAVNPSSPACCSPGTPQPNSEASPRTPECCTASQS